MNPESDALVIFGVTGDLAYKKIIPAVYRLYQRGRLQGPVFGVARPDWSIEELRERFAQSLREHAAESDPAAIAPFVAQLRYVAGDYRDPATFAKLRDALGPAQAPLHYLAIPPSLFGEVIARLDESGCTRGARVVVEKPLGRDLASAQALNRVLARVFDEERIFRIDHFLGKESVQNLLYFRFANEFLEPVWNAEHVASVQLTLAESFGIEGRGKFYEEVGAVRDVVQNHLLQVVCLLAMDAPARYDSDAVRDEKVKVLRAARPLEPGDVVRGQYEGYRAESGVAPGSRVETYSAVRLEIRSPRWAGVPFLIRAGKQLAVTGTQVMVRLRAPARQLFEEGPPTPNYVHFRLGPGRVSIGFGVRTKEPGEEMVGRPSELLMCDLDSRTGAYERLIGDALRGDPTLFARQDSIESAWRIVDPILTGPAVAVEPFSYAAGSWGPREAEAIAADAGGWFNPTFGCD